MASTIRLVEFEQVDGGKIMINPAEVASVEENKGRVMFRLRLWSGDTTVVVGVVGTLQSVIDKLEA